MGVMVRGALDLIIKRISFFPPINSTTGRRRAVVIFMLVNSLANELLFDDFHDVPKANIRACGEAFKFIFGINAYIIA